MQSSESQDEDNLWAKGQSESWLERWAISEKAVVHVDLRSFESAASRT